VCVYASACVWPLELLLVYSLIFNN